MAYPSSILHELQALARTVPDLLLTAAQRSAAAVGLVSHSASGAFLSKDGTPLPAVAEWVGQFTGFTPSIQGTLNTTFCTSTLGALANKSRVDIEIALRIDNPTGASVLTLTLGAVLLGTWTRPLSATPGECVVRASLVCTAATAQAISGLMLDGAAATPVASSVLYTTADTTAGPNILSIKLQHAVAGCTAIPRYVDCRVQRF